MKKNIFIALLLMVSIISFSQPTINPAPAIQTDYLKKSKKQKTTATIVLISGTILIASPFLFRADGLYAPVTVGLLCLPASLGLFISSSSNKKKAMRLSFKNETVPQIQNVGFTNQSIPSLSLKINLRGAGPEK